MQVYFFFFYFFVYGVIGWCLEVAYAAVEEKKFVNRGFLNGPICPIYGCGVSVVLLLLTPFRDNLVVLYFLSAILVTVIEGLTGYIMDKIFHHKWWDYAEFPFNIGGYVCLPFSIIWGMACVLIVKVIHPGIQKLVGWIPFPVGIVILVCAGIALLADLIITAAAVLKMNHSLEMLENIAKELRGFSDKLGENIYENVTGIIELGEEGKKKRAKAAEVIAEYRSKRDVQQAQRKEKKEEYRVELRQSYDRLATQMSKTSRRFLKAFPTMESRQHKEILDELKKKLRR